jgi:putative ABC transport system ATP-binding protein
VTDGGEAFAETDRSGRSRPCPMSELPLFATRGLAKTYPQGETVVTALRGVDLDIRAREFVVVAGPSGCGKTTLLNLLGGLDDADRGEVRFAGALLATQSESDRTLVRREKLGFVFQSFNLVPVLSAFENVEYGLWLVGVPKGERRKRVSEVLDSVGLGGRGGRRPSQLSGGERQRVALARALVHDPLAVLADEPTASLDSETGQSIIDLFTRMNAEKGTTFVLATHDPAIIDRAPRRVRLRDGVVVEDEGGRS